MIIYGFMQYFYMDFVPWEKVVGRKRIVSTLGNNSYLAEYLAVVFFITISMVYQYRRTWRGWLLLVFLPVELTLIVLTNSRNALISIVFIFLIVSVFFYKKILLVFKNRYFVKMISTVFIIVIVLWFWPRSIVRYNWSQLMDRFSTGVALSDSSVQNRLVLWKTTVSLWTHSPWTGIGMGQFPIQFIDELDTILKGPQSIVWQLTTSNMEEIQADESHNDYLQILAEWGIFGYDLWLIFLSILAVRAVRIIRGNISGWWVSIHSEHRNLLIGLSLAWFTFLLIMFFAFPLRLPVSGMLFFVLCGIIGGSASPYISDSDRKPKPLSYIFRVPIIIASLSIIVWWWGEMGAHFQSNIFTLWAELDFKDEKYKHAEEFIYRATKFYPGNGDAYFILGNVYADTGYYRKANDTYDKAYETMNNPSLWINKGLLSLQMRRYSEAEMIWQKISQINPNHRKLRYLYGMMNYYNANFPEAEEAFSKELRLWPDDIEARFYLAEVNIRLKDYDKAIENLQTIVKKYSPNHRGAWERLGYAYGKKQIYKKAIEAYKKSSDINFKMGNLQDYYRLNKEVEKYERLIK